MTDADKLTKQIETYVSQLREVGWCVVEGVVPENEVNAIRQHVETAHLEAIEEYETAGGSLTHQRDKDGGPGKNVIAFIQPLAPYLAEKRVVGVIKAVLNPHVRIAQTEFKTRPPNDHNKMYRLTTPIGPTPVDGKSGCCRQVPLMHDGTGQDMVCSHHLGPKRRHMVVPGIHRDPRNPRGLEDGIDEFKPYPPAKGFGPAGSVVIIDSVSGTRTRANPSRQTSGDCGALVRGGECAVWQNTCDRPT